MYDKLQKRICRTVGPSHDGCLEVLARCQNAASLGIGITLVDVHLNRLDWFHFLILEGVRPVILVDCTIFCHNSLMNKDVYVNSVFLCTARLWVSLTIECFPVTYDLNGFNFSISR